jgi:hypothetical protein
MGTPSKKEDYTKSDRRSLHFGLTHLLVLVSAVIATTGIIFAAGFVWFKIDPPSGMGGLGNAIILGGAWFPSFATVRALLGPRFLSEGWESILWGVFEMAVIAVVVSLAYYALYGPML